LIARTDKVRVNDFKVIALRHIVDHVVIMLIMAVIANDDFDARIGLRVN
jgi:hypothetical protein